jgi:two-component system sensor histidine kinase TctE
MRKFESLRSQLLLRLTLPLIFVVVLDTAVSYYVALHYANKAYDRWLLDSARSLAQEVKAQKGKVTFELPPTALEIFRWDEVDKTFFKIQSRRIGFMAGDRAVPDPPDPALARDQPYYFDSQIQGKKVRAVAMLMAPTDSSEEVLVEVAETLNKRRSMMQDILLAVVSPQVLLVLVTGLHIWRGVNRGLRPLHDLTREIAQRSPEDLAPMPDSHVPLEVRSLIHTINELLERLASAIAAQQRLIENAAHQLRTPLAGLKVQADRALRADDFAAMQPALLQIKHCADRVSHLSTQLLVLARSESSLNVVQRFVPVDLCRLARETCMDWVPKALERDIELSFDGPCESAWVPGDENLLRELLNNLLDNAIRYGRKHGQITVDLRVEPVLLLAVDDDGPGIPEPERDRIFERFYRIPGSPGDGCGLGLAIVKEIAELHSAGIAIRPGRSGRGSRIEVVFERSDRNACTSGELIRPGSVDGLLL